MSERSLDQLPRVLAVPSDRCWFDPQLLNVATSPQLTDVSLAMSEAKVIVPANPRRWGLGFGFATIAAPVHIAPWPDVATIPFGIVTLTNSVPFYTLSTIGPLVCNQWSAFTTFAQSFRVVELLRN